MKVSLWAEIHRLSEIEKLSQRAISKRLGCARKTVKKALALAEPPRAPAPRPSILDPYKPRIERLIGDSPELSAVRVLEEIARDGYRGEVTLVRDFVREIRPSGLRVYQEVEYAPAQAMQVDWGHVGSVELGEGRRKVSVFVAVLCWSRLIYVEFTLSQSMGTFYRCLVRAVEFFGGSPLVLIVDNLKAAVLRGSGRHAVFHPNFEAFCAHYGRMRPLACERADPESKGVVEGGVRYVKRNALQGRQSELERFEDYRRLALYWRDEIANVRKHATTGERPLERFEKERRLLRPLPALGYDTDDVLACVVTPHARVRFDTNRYSVPPEYARRQVTLRADDDWVWVVHRGEEIARHRRSYERRKLITDPEHHKAALALRRRSRARQIEAEFDSLGPEAKSFRLKLLKAPVKPTLHLRRILELVRLYGRTEVMGAISRALEYGTCDAGYVQNLIDQERRRRQLPSPLPLNPKRKELLEEIDFEEPDPRDYDRLFGEGEDP